MLWLLERVYIVLLYRRNDLPELLVQHTNRLPSPARNQLQLWKASRCENKKNGGPFDADD